MGLTLRGGLADISVAGDQMAGFGDQMAGLVERLRGSSPGGAGGWGAKGRPGEK